MPRWTRFPSRTIVCMHRPPFPGFHCRAWAWLLIPPTISHVSPASELRNSDAGSTPHHRSFLPLPGRHGATSGDGGQHGDDVPRREASVESLEIAHQGRIDEHVDVATNGAGLVADATIQRRMTPLDLRERGAHGGRLERQLRHA